MTVALHVTGDCIDVKSWQRRIPSKGTAVQGVRLYAEGKHIGRIVDRPTYVMEPDGESLQIWYEPVEKAA